MPTAKKGAKKATGQPRGAPKKGTDTQSKGGTLAWIPWAIAELLVAAIPDRSSDSQALAAVKEAIPQVREALRQQGWSTTSMPGVHDEAALLKACYYGDTGTHYDLTQAANRRPSKFRQALQRWCVHHLIRVSAGETLLDVAASCKLQATPHVWVEQEIVQALDPKSRCRSM